MGIMAEKNKTPFISVIVPVYNDYKGLDDTLKSLVNQDYSGYEIIVVTNNSNNSTLNVSSKYKSEFPHLVRTFKENNIQSSYAARNKGIINSNGSILAFIDADMTVKEDWLTKIIGSLEKNKADYLGCRVEIYEEKSTVFSKYNKMTGFPIERYINTDNFAPTCCLVVRKKVFSEVGFFDSRLVSGGDTEFGNRVYRHKYRLHYDPDIIMCHPARSSFKKIISKTFRIGMGHQQLQYYYPRHFPSSRRNIINPVYYLPSVPWNFSKAWDGTTVWNNASFGTKIGLYLVHWTNKLGKRLGYIFEILRRKKDHI